MKQSPDDLADILTNETPAAAAPTRTDAAPHATRTASEAPPPQVPRLIPGGLISPLSQHHDPDRYEIIGEHGRGGLGRVTRAYDHNLGRDIAIKELLAHSPLGEMRFMREALITARLEHPGIVPVHEAGRWPDGTPFYAMKLVAGRPLRALLAERTTVEARLSLLHHVIAVADAIAYAHGRGIIHRDLKPANVIVGDFGETVVIDWGLAKDLRASDDGAGTAPSPSPDSPDLGLTSAGSILGTPAYMAPEQARGEPVDQRADVFAIGAMLWELCSLAKVPPSDRRLRHRLLRRAGIDRDLVAIIDKALATDRDARYPDAGALAVDLKAFKAGARIASRDYSPLGSLAHWARRHRALSLAITAAIVVVVAGTALYVRDVTAARNRADDFNNDLILSNAESLMQSDPTAAAELLRRYTGPDRQRLTMLETEAQSRGIAILKIRPHDENSRFAFGIEGGNILAYGDGGQILKISPMGASHPVARNLPDDKSIEYFKQRHLIGFTCARDAICLLGAIDEQLHARLAIQSGSAEITTISMSPDGSYISAGLADGHIDVWQITDLSSPRHIFRGAFAPIRWIQAINQSTIFVVMESKVSLLHLHEKDSSATITDIPVQAADITWIRSTHPANQQNEAIITRTGDLLLIDGQTGHTTAHTKACDGSAFSVFPLSHSPEIVYSCINGDVGIWDTEHNSTRTIAHYDSAIFELAASQDESQLYLGGFSGDIIAYNLVFNRELKYVGHAGRIFVLQPPSTEFPYLLSADHLGSIRVWLPIPDDTTVLYQARGALTKAWFAPDQHSVFTLTSANELSLHHDGGTEIISNKVVPHRFLQLDRKHARALSFGGDGDLDLWSLDGKPVLRVFHASEVPVLAAAFSPDGESLFAGTESGHIISRRLDRTTSTSLGKVDGAALWFYPCPGSNQTALRTGGSTWMITDDRLRLLRKETRFNNVGSCAPNGAWLALGSGNGKVDLVSTVGGSSLTLFEASASIKSLAFSPDSGELAIVAENELTTRALTSRASTTFARPVRIARANQATYSVDGKWLTITCDNGDVWFYQRAEARWVYRSVGTARVTSSCFSDDSGHFATVDAGGKLVLFDLTAEGFR